MSERTPPRARARRRALIAVLAATAILAGAGPGAASAAQLSATPASLAAIFESARGGDTILLAPGSYGVFRGAMKPAMVTLAPQPGASVKMDLKFAPAANITIDGVTLDDVEIADSATKNIVVRNADIPGQVIFRTGELANANIVFDHNVHHDFNKCDTCAEGRITLMDHTSRPAGITIQNSEFRGGMSDGISNGANGLRILDNTFHDLIPGTPAGVHTDAIQLYGSKNTLVKGNYIHDIQGQQIMSPDGADHETIEDNVIAADPGGYPFVVNLGSDDGSIIRHNTFPGGPCAFKARCGTISLNAKPGNPRGRGTIIKDNVLGGALDVQDGSSAAEVSFNVFAALVPTTSSNLRGAAQFVGGAHPTTYAGYGLAAGSPGTGNASDGGDRGIRLAGRTGPPDWAGGSLGVAAGMRIRVLTKLRTLSRTAKLRLAVTASSAGTVVLGARARPGRAVTGKGAGHSRRPILLEQTTVGFGRAGRRTVAITLGRIARRMLARSRDARLSVQVYADAGRRRLLRSFKLKIKR